jgi:hypothetical protein
MTAANAEAMRDLAKSLDEFALSSVALAPEELAQRLDQMEAEQSHKLRMHPDLQLETTRRIEECKFLILSQRNLPAETVDALYRQVCSLGFTDLAVEVVIGMSFGQYCIRTGRPQHARAAIDSLIRKLKEPTVHRKFAVFWLKRAEAVSAGLK